MSIEREQKLPWPKAEHIPPTDWEAFEADIKVWRASVLGRKSIDGSLLELAKLAGSVARCNGVSTQVRTVDGDTETSIVPYELPSSKKPSNSKTQS